MRRPTAALRRRLTDTKAAIGLAARRRDSLVVIGAVTVVYLLAYLWAAGNLSFRPDVDPGLLVVSDPLGRAFLRTGPASFEAVAVLDTGVVRLLVAPLNVAIGLSIAMLVGVSLALSYLAVVRPQACGIGAGSGLLASVPALLSGTVCCGPVVLIALGIQASGLLVSLFAWLLPLGVALLVGSLIYLGGKIDTTDVAAV
jgi:hypothetical protein